MAASLAGLFSSNPVWSNPEFVRHRRAELRPVRAITVAVVVGVLCLLLGMACWSYEQNILEGLRRAAETYATEAWNQRLVHMQRNFARNTWLLFYQWLVGIQGVALTFWTLFSCAQSVSGERDRKTWDFQRTTRLTPAEILVGKLLGEPVLIYFAVLCATPVTFIAGLAGGLSIGSVISVFVFLAVTSLFLGLGGMWLSTLLESRTRGVGLIGALALYGFTLGVYGFRDSGLPGLAAISPLTGIIDLLGLNATEPRLAPVLFGHEVRWVLMSVLLCSSFGAWLTVMLMRNLKRDYQEIRPLSRWQAVGCAAFLNFLIYALLSPASTSEVPIYGNRASDWFTDAKVVATFAVAMNGLILFLMGLATLTPQERLKVWRRKRATGESAVFADDGLPWPWLWISAVVAYALMVWGLLAWDHTLPLDMSTLQTAAIRMLLVLVFVTRDVLFLQWCMLTRLRQPVVKGVLFLGLYYAAAAVLTVLAGVVASENGASWMLALLTPVQVFDSKVTGMGFPVATYAGLALQTGVIGVVLIAISSRLQRPMRVGAAA
jgi:hypothetical protein